MAFDRRSVLKATGAALGGTLFSTTGLAAGRRIDGLLDVSSEELQEALVMVRPGAGYGFLDQYELPEGTFEMETLDIVYTKASGPELRRIAGHRNVEYVQANRELEYNNGDAQAATKAGIVQDGLGYTGKNVHVAVIDSGLDAYHPDLIRRVEHHFQFVNPLQEGVAYVPASYADTDDIGHGTHCAGTIAGEGTIESDKEGMAPEVDLTMYSQGVGIFILNSVAAFDHILGELHPDDPVNITSNSYGSTDYGPDFNPSGAWERATWRAFEEGILSVGSAGNSGPGTNTLGPSKTGPHTLSVAASHDGQGQGLHDTKQPTNFSSRGRTASYEDGEGARWDEFPDGTGGYTAEDRGTGLDNLRALKSKQAQDRETINTFEESVTVGPGADASGFGGPHVGSSAFVEYDPDSVAANVRATLSWPDGTQDIDLFLRKGAADGPVVASSTNGNTTAPSPGGGDLEVLATDIDSDATYVFEVDPWAGVQADCTLTVEERGPPPAVDLPGDPEGPLGVYRPGVIAPGHAVVSPNGASAMKPVFESGVYGTAITGDPSYLDPQGPVETGPFYVSISGTSMSCPVVAGICALVMEAWYLNNGEVYPTPEQVIRIVEGTAQETTEDAYTPYNAGAGFVNARRAVKAAIRGDVPDYADVRLPSADTGGGEGGPEAPDLTAAGSRADDGQVFTGGQTNRIRITVSETSDSIRVTDQVPADWTVYTETGDVASTGDGTVDLGRVDPSDLEDGSVTRTYFVEAPSGPSMTGSYTFGPARGELIDGDASVEISGTDTNYVVGQST